MRRPGGRDYPDIFKNLRPRVRNVVPGRWWNVRKYFFPQRHIGMSLDLGNATPVKDHQSFLIPRSRVPAYALSRFELHRASAHPAGLWSSCEQWAVAPRTVQGKSNRLPLCMFLRRDDAERERDTDEYKLNVPHGVVRSPEAVCSSDQSQAVRQLAVCRADQRFDEQRSGLSPLWHSLAEFVQLVGDPIGYLVHQV
jgi:hypothetical protein